MGLPKSIRFDKELEEKVEEYLKANNIKFVQLIDMAITKFISETQTIVLEPVDTKRGMKSVKKLYSKHKNAMDILKK